MDNKEYVVFIPVRGGSKSIPGKNIKLINGRPLIYWVIDAVVCCADIKRIYISTDSKEIENTVIKYKSEEKKDSIFVIKRSRETATDFATTESAMLEFAKKNDFKNIILLQATNPLVNSTHLSEAIKLHRTKKFDSIVSVVRQKRFIWKREGIYGVPENYDFYNRPRRQDFDGFLVENGSFYITSKKRLLESRCRISGRIGMYEMDEDSYYEIDEPSDWKIVEELLRQRRCKKSSCEIKLFAMDCDGVLTDGGMYYTANGDELKKFNTKDGMGISKLKQSGIKTAIITGENSNIVLNRAKKIGIDYTYLGIDNKFKVLQKIAMEEKIEMLNIAYIGDDSNDIECLSKVGLSMAVADATNEAKSASKVVLNKEGGKGAVREAIEYIIGQ